MPARDRLACPSSSREHARARSRARVARQELSLVDHRVSLPLPTVTGGARGLRNGERLDAVLPTRAGAAAFASVAGAGVSLIGQSKGLDRSSLARRAALALEIGIDDRVPLESALTPWSALIAR